MTSADEARLREEVAQAYCRAGELKLNELASGNVSCRFEDGMLISPTGASSESITAESVVFVGPGGQWSGGHRPSSEWQMHWAIYGAHPKARAVVHTHSDYCVALSCHNAPLPGFHYLVGVFGGDDVPCVPYSTFGGEQLARDAAEALTDRNACLLGNHGMICRAGSLASAIGLAHRLEIMCRQYILARQLGEPSRLTPAEWEDFHRQSREWSYGGRR
jgi:L-fuculose-phosphate aldolase